MSALKIGFIHRLRIESWDNAVHLDASQRSDNTYSRHRTSLVAAWTPRPKLELGLKLTNEFRIYSVPRNKKFTWHEVFVESLYLRLQQPADLPLTLTFGRQDIMLGEGFVVMDGGPLDGSRSAYFNSARAEFRIAPKQNLTAFYFYQPPKDNILPLIHGQSQPLVEQPEEGIGLYYSGMLKSAAVEAYLIRKNIRATDGRPVASGITTLGTRLTLSLVPALSLTGEGAIQGGHYGVSGRRAFGGHFHLDYQFEGVLPTPLILTLGGIGLSGDDPRTHRLEGWDPLFSRWPKWSESFIYTLIPETGKPAYWTNLASLNAGLKWTPAKPVDLSVTYHRLSAFQKDGTSVFISGGPGKIRGDLVISKLVFRLDKRLSGHLWWETFSPGNYYRSGADSFNWFRFELLLRL